MRENRILDDYISSIDRELFGLDPKDRNTVLEEVRAHLTEEAKEAAYNKGMDRPNEGTVRDVIKNFGSPFDVAHEYRKNMRIKTPISIKTILFYCLFIGMIDLLVMLFYFRDAYWEAIYRYTDHSYLWGAIAIGIVYGILGITVEISSIVQLRDTKKISYLGNITLIIAVFSVVAAIMGGILQQVAGYELDIDLWFYPNNLVMGAIALVPILVFLISLPIVDKFRKILDIKEEDPARITKLRKRGQTLAVSSCLVFLVVFGILAAGLFDHERVDGPVEWREKELIDVIEPAIIQPALHKHAELLAARAQTIRTRHVSDYKGE